MAVPGEAGIDPEHDEEHSGTLIRPLLLLAGLCLMILVGEAAGLDDRFPALRSWIKSIGPWGYGAFLGVYVAATLLAVPATILTFSSGLLFDAWVGTALASLGATAGGALCFLVARYVARGPLSAWASRHPRFKRLDRAAERNSALVVAVARLIPVMPYNLLNYAMGLTGIPLRTFVLWSWLCMLPITYVVVAAGDAAGRWLSRGEMDLGALIAGGVILVGLLAAAAVIRRRTRRLGEKPAN